jgi:hypothetical protein
VKALLVAIAVLAVAGAARAESVGLATVVAPIRDDRGILRITIRCAAAPNVETCAGGIVFPQLDDSRASFDGIAPGGKKIVVVDLPGGDLSARMAKLDALTVELTQTMDGVDQTTTSTVAVLRVTSTGGGGGGTAGGVQAPGAQGGDAPTIPRGPATRYSAVRDPRGDARSSIQLPQLFDIVLATAKRQGNAVVLTVVSTSAITKHDGFGNPIAPCVQIPWASAQQYPMFLFGNGQLSGYTQKVWPKMKTSIHGGTISWTIPRTVLARKGFTKGFLWRATGVCDAHYRADFAPNKGFATFRWVKVG